MNKGNFEFLILNFEFGWISKLGFQIGNFFNSKLRTQNLKFPSSRFFCFALLTFALSYLHTLPTEAIPLTTGADFLLMTTGARPDGMGQAFSAVADDVNTLSFNPAGLGNIHLPEVGYGHENFAAEIGYDFVGAAIPAGGMGVFGLGYVGMGAPPFNSTANPSAPLVTAKDTAFIGGWGKSFYDFHVGAAVKYISRQIDTVQGSGFGFDLGIRYRVFPTLTFAASGLNIGPGIKLASMEQLPAVINVGGAWTALEQPDHTLNITSDASYNVNANIARFGFGGEYWFKNTVAIRGGYLANSQDEGFSAGAGIKVSFFQLDYAFQPFATLGQVHRFSGLMRWDGPWVKGVEPNAPKYVNVHQNPKAMEIRWEKSTGPVDGYEVLIQPLDGSDLIISPKTINPIFYFENFESDTLYKISVRAVGGGDVKSFPSKEFYYLSPEKSYTSEKEAASGQASISRNVTGKVDGAGLQLSWEKPGTANGGFNIYRRSPSGRVEKVNQEPKKDTRVWLTDATGLQGWEWIVTGVSGDGKVEKTIGTYLWYPTSRETDSLIERPKMILHASPQEHRKLYLDWDGDAAAVGYVLLFSRHSDNVYEFYGNLNRLDPTALLEISGKHREYYFIVVPKDRDGVWLKRSSEAKAVLLAAEPVE